MENDVTDIELKQMIVAGNPEGLARAFASYRHRLKQTIKLRLNRRLSGRLDESDVVQETFLAAVRDCPSYAAAPNVTVFVWLHHLTTQRLADLHREHMSAEKRAVGREAASFDGPRNLPGGEWAVSEMLADSITSPSDNALRHERQQHVLRGLKMIDVIDREVLVLRHFEMLSNEETAMVLGLTPSAANNRYMRAIKRLNVILSTMMELT